MSVATVARKERRKSFMATLKQEYNDRHLGNDCHSNDIEKPIFQDVICEVIAATQHTFHAGFLEGVNLPELVGIT